MSLIVQLFLGQPIQQIIRKRALIKIHHPACIQQPEDMLQARQIRFGTHRSAVNTVGIGKLVKLINDIIKVLGEGFARIKVNQLFIFFPHKFGRRKEAPVAKLRLHPF